MRTVQKREKIFQPPFQTHLYECVEQEFKERAQALPKARQELQNTKEILLALGLRSP